MTLPPMPEPAHEQVEDYSGIAVNKVVVTPLFTSDQMIAYAELAVAAERDRWKAATALCEKHQPNGGARGYCVICSGMALAAALSKISYLCGEPNEMGVGPYDVHCDEDAVIEQVRLLRTAERERCAAICDARSADHWRAYSDKSSPHFCDARFEAFSDEAEECAKLIRGDNVGIEPPYSVGSNDGLGVCPIDATTVGAPMHTAPMADSQGEFAEFKVQPEIACRKCGVHAVSMREWESSCGGYEDYQYRCNSCGHSWWCEGCDA